jgi:uncharacterized membrane protein YdjX (TVP38/TMEM64 family)
MNRRWIGAAAVLVLVAVATWLATSHGSLATVVGQEAWLRQRITDHPIQSWALGFVVYLLISLVPGTRGKAVVCGWLFGFWPALVMVNVSLTLAALFGFFISRHLIRDVVTSRYRFRFDRVNEALREKGAFYVILLRIVPVSFSLTNYVLGATQLDRKTFWWATQLGLLPGNVVFVNAGAQLPSLSEWARHGWSAILSMDVVASIIALSLFTLLVPALAARWTRRRASLKGNRERRGLEGTTNDEGQMTSE